MSSNIKTPEKNSKPQTEETSNQQTPPKSGFAGLIKYFNQMSDLQQAYTDMLAYLEEKVLATEKKLEVLQGEHETLKKESSEQIRYLQKELEALKMVVETKVI